MNHIPQRFAGVVLAMMLCLVSSAGWVDAQEVKTDSESAADSAEPPKPTENPAVGIEAWLASILLQLQPDAEETSTSPKIKSTVKSEIKKQAENVYVVSIIIEDETAERYGLLRLHWDQKRVANLTVVAGVDRPDHCYVISTVGGFSELKAPLGTWQLAEEGIPRAYS